jgi:hypothetical protein
MQESTKSSFSPPSFHAIHNTTQNLFSFGCPARYLKNRSVRTDFSVRNAVKTILPEIRASKKEGENEIMFLQNKHIKSSG